MTVIVLVAEVGFEIEHKCTKCTVKNRKCLQVPKGRFTSRTCAKTTEIIYSEPHEGCVDIQQNTLSQALKQSLVVSSETKVSAMYHQREVIDHQLDELLTTWKN